MKLSIGGWYRVALLVFFDPRPRRFASALIFCIGLIFASAMTFASELIFVIRADFCDRCRFFAIGADFCDRC